MAKKTVYGRVDRFKRGRTTLNDEKRSGWPSKSRTDDHHFEVEALIKENKQNVASEIELTVGISYWC
jgi:transposase